MNLSWSVVVLALIGAQDQQPSQPKTPGPPIAIEICGPRMVGSDSCRQAATAIAAEANIRTTTARMSRVMARLVDRCIERCVDLVVDEAKAAIIAKLTEPPGISTKLAKVTSDAASSAPPKDLLNATLPMKLPKMAKPRTVNDPEATEAWPMTLEEATRIALDNSEVVRVIAFGANNTPIGGIEPPCGNFQRIPGEASPGRIVISRLNADASAFRFKAEIMAEVRSVEQQYWSLAQVHVQLWAADRAVSLAQEILKREEAELMVGRGTVADVAEAAQRLEQFQLDLVTRTSDLITTERQLRNLLGLPPADNRRIIPVTPPSEQRIEYDWDTCLGEMMENQPDIVQQKLLVRVAELRLLLARNQLIPQLDPETLDQLGHLGQQLVSPDASVHQVTLNLLNPIVSQPEKAARSNAGSEDAKGFTNWVIGYTFQMPMGRNPLANSRQAQYYLLRSRAYMKQVEHQTTHSLARFFLEVDANYKQYKTSSRLRSAAAQRLDAQRAYYEEGRITIDRFLDAVSQYATAVATEAQYKTTYNVTLAALAEAKGTLLADRDIVIAERPKRRNPYVQATKPAGSVATPVPTLSTIPGKPAVAAPGLRVDRGPGLGHSAIPGKPAMSAPSDPATTAHTSKWKGTRDLMTIATAFAADMPQDVEVPRIRPRNSKRRVPTLIISPLTSVTDESCCDAEPEDSGAVAKDKASGISTECAETEPSATEAKASGPAKGKTWTFSLSIGGAANPLQIKGTITEVETAMPAAGGH